MGMRLDVEHRKILEDAAGIIDQMHRVEGRTPYARVLYTTVNDINSILRITWNEEQEGNAGRDNGGRSAHARRAANLASSGLAGVHEEAGPVSYAVPAPPVRGGRVEDTSIGVELQHSSVDTSGGERVTEVGPGPVESEDFRLGGNQVSMDKQALYPDIQLQVANTPEAQVLVDAIKTINGERQDQYGNAEDSFQLIANYWTTWLQGRYPGEMTFLIDAKDAAMMMQLTKVARESNSPKRDNRLDGAGYWALAERIEAKERDK